MRLLDDTYPWYVTYEAVKAAHTEATSRLQHCICTRDADGEIVTNPECWWTLSDTEQQRRHDELVIQLMEHSSQTPREPTTPNPGVPERQRS